MKSRVSRKAFLAGATKTIVAASVGAVSANALAGDDQTRQMPIMPKAVQSYTWPYTRLDPEDIRARAHKAYYDGGCGYGAFNAVVSALAEKIGEPFTMMPTQMMYFGGGGGAGWGTLCGALNGAGLAIDLVVDRANSTAIIGELFGWYTKASFPSDISNDRAIRHTFLVNRYDKTLLQTIAGSPLCHTSVSKWCTESGFRATAAERSERCARLTGDVSAKAVEMVNDYFSGTFRAGFVPARAVPSCLGCHDTAGIGNVNPTVKMDCQQCHHEHWDHLY
jgi:putative redox-active protein with C_GCAxxG_C_C motif